MRPIRTLPRKRSLSKGFMLLETTIAMYTLLMGVLTFAAMAVFANKVQLQAQMRANAYQLAYQQTQILQTTNFDNLHAVAATPFDIPQEIIDSFPGSSNSKYEMTGDYVVTNTSSTTKMVTVRIKWRNASTPEGQVAPWSNVRLATVLVKPGSVTAATGAKE